MDRVDLDWSNLGFGLTPTDCNVRCTWRNGQWGPLEFSASSQMSIPIAATALHYGQALFEGMKAFETVDGKTVLFRPEKNAERMMNGARKLLMECPSEELFLEAVTEVVKRNIKYLPPCDSGASLYIRPLLIGTGERVGVKPADEYQFIVLVTPVGPYFKSGMKPIRIRVEEEINRAAPRGVGDIKAAGNYAAGMRATMRAKQQGFDNVLYLDASQGQFLDETSATNFFGIKVGRTSTSYVTPRSMSILPSVTNDSLMTISKDLGMTLEHRPVHVSELTEFSEAGCCGTAAVIAPVGSIQWGSKDITYHADGNAAGPWTMKLYDTLTGIQKGRVEDKYSWLLEI